MRIEQVLYKNIPKTIYRRGFSLSFPRGAKDIYFKLEKDLTKRELWEVLGDVNKLPSGYMHIEALGQFNYFRISYYPEEVTEQSILEFVNGLNFNEK